MSTQLQAQTKVSSISKPSSRSIPTRLLQRKCVCGGSVGLDGECAGCREKRLSVQRRATTPAAPYSRVPLIVHDVLRSPGQPMNTGTRAFMEPRFGHDFSNVRVHTDAKAAESAQSVNALAYTAGRDIVFGSGQYAPGTSEGRKLLAHELTHVVQRGEITSQALNGFSSPRSASEQDAISVAKHIEQKAPPKSQVSTNIHPRNQGTLQREQDAGVFDASVLSGGIVDTQDAGPAINTGKTTEPKTEKKTCALTTFSASNFVGKTVTADFEFIPSLNAINTHAVANNVNIFITDSFRETGATVHDAIVKPAKFSNHHAGHAIDMNVQYGSKNELCNSKCLAGTRPAEVNNFIKAIQRDSTLRWGGEFKNPGPDPVHIDDGLNSNITKWNERFQATQEARKSGCG